MTSTAYQRLAEKTQRLERELREARAREARIRALHTEREVFYLPGKSGMGCAECHRVWPCPTIRALDQDGDDVA